MLIMFRVKNFASFRDEVVLDLRAVSYKDMKSHVLDGGKNKVVKTMALFGKNAGGKSNLISALYYFESFVFNQFFDAGDREDEIDKGERLPGVRRSTFKLSAIQDNTSEFEIVFYHNNKTYQYGFHICDIPNEKRYIITEEWLLVDDKSVFERAKGTLEFGKKYEHELKQFEKLRDDRLYVGVLDYFAVGEVRTIIDGLKEYLKERFNVYFELILEGSVKGMVSGVSFSKRLHIEENMDENTKEHRPFDVKTVHNVYDNNGNFIREELFELNMESSGTLRYFSFIQKILNVIEKGGVFIVDELSARLHPILTKFIVDLFQGDMNKSAQLIFTTHDTSLLNRTQLRRDEIVFVEKNDLGVSSVYSMADIKVRSDASFAKDYLLGKYGAVPMLREDGIESETVGEWFWGD